MNKTAASAATSVTEAKVVEAAPCEGVYSGFESRPSPHCRCSSVAEQRLCNARVEGSIPLHRLQSSAVLPRPRIGGPILGVVLVNNAGSEPVKVGSTPTPPANIAGTQGSKAAFEAADVGSIPTPAAKDMAPSTIGLGHPPLKWESVGSNPRGATNMRKWRNGRRATFRPS